MAEKRNIKVICVMVSSLNGHITYGTDPHIYTWTSKEDQEHFFHLIERARCIIMGKNTYEQAKGMMQHRKGRLRIVLTSSPNKYKSEAIPGQLEFTADQPALLLRQLEQRGYADALLVGGSTTNTSFVEAGCIDEVWLTIEPLIFPNGIPLFGKIPQRKFHLISLEKLNEQGTLLLKYR